MQIWGLFLGVVLFFLTLIFFDPIPDNPLIGQMAAVVVLMATWWVTEAVPLAITSLLPMILFPLFGINSPKTTASAYMNSIIFLYIGGFLVALAMERWNLHRRIALNIIHKIGKNPAQLIFGFMVAAAFLSMWISNTATAVMMLPIGMAIIGKLEEEFNPENARKMGLTLLLGIAYGCSIGGVATLVGTPTNLAFAKIYTEMFPDAEPVSFGQWFIFGLPLSIIVLIISWYILVKWVARIPKSLNVNVSVVKTELDALGKMTFEEKVVVTAGSLTALLWIFRKDLTVGGFHLPGWAGISPLFETVDDSTVAILMAVILFVLPVQNKESKAKAILETNAIRDLPWTAILLFGGGFAVAGGFASSGLTEYLAGQFNALGTMPLWLTVFIACLGVTLVTEFVSNIATVQMFLPVLAAWAIAQDMHPLLVMIPATMVSSMAFMMPVATPPNAVIFGSGKVSVMDMVRFGWVIKIVSLFIVVILMLSMFSLIDITEVFN